MTLIPFKTRQAAEIKAREVSTNPIILELPDGSYVAVGDTLLRADGSTDRVLYGRRGSHALESQWW